MPPSRTAAGFLIVDFNLSELGGCVLVADFSQGPPAVARYRENWGDADLLNGWHDVSDLFLVGRLMASERAQALFINRPEVRTPG